MLRVSAVQTFCVFAPECVFFVKLSGPSSRLRSGPDSALWPRPEPPLTVKFQFITLKI